MRHLISILKSLSDETRFKLIRLLLTQDLCGRALAQRLGVSEAAVSQHLKVLKEAGLVEGEKRGYWIHYSVRRDVLKQVIQELEHLACRTVPPSSQCQRLHAMTRGYKGKEAKAMCQCCCERHEKLKDKPEDCTPEQIRDCHGDVKEHPCREEKKKKT
jgi:ArsR family transcriptional regulator